MRDPDSFARFPLKSLLLKALGRLGLLTPTALQRKSLGQMMTGGFCTRIFLSYQALLEAQLVDDLLIYYYFDWLIF